jgi:hypothetical protein
LRERKPVGLVHGNLQVAGRQIWIELLQISLSQLRARIGKVDDSVESTRSTQYGRIQDCGFIGGCHDDDTFTSTDAVQTVKELL